MCLTEITLSDSQIFCRVLGSIILNLWCVCVYGTAGWELYILTFRRRNFLLNFSTPCIQNVNNTGTKKGSIMK